jgi:hypothetical protein
VNLSTNVVPRTWHDIKDHAARLADAINNILRGKLNNTGTITLTESSATSTLTDVRIGINSVITLQPTTANAAAELATLYFGAASDGTVTIHHANNAQTDRTFLYAIIG